MTLYYTGIQCEIREVKLSNKPPQTLELSPKGTVPVLILPCGTVIDQSIDIMQWALRQNAPDKWLSDMNNLESDILIERNDTFFKQALDHFKYPSRYLNYESFDTQKVGLEILYDIDTRLKNNNLTLGDNMRFAEIAIFPFIRQFASVDKNWFDMLPLKSLQEWLNAYLNNPLFLNIMQKYTPWNNSDAPVLFLP